jgi:hypothetical protein
VGCPDVNVLMIWCKLHRLCGTELGMGMTVKGKMEMVGECNHDQCQGIILVFTWKD